jgi:Fe-S-cluster-containing dehydrogenase component
MRYGFVIDQRKCIGGHACAAVRGERRYWARAERAERDLATGQARSGK